jgi:Na+-transporting methylmalonyl-CoA/oxaloacetate decarboxylase gamma subunit
VLELLLILAVVVYLVSKLDKMRDEAVKETDEEMGHRKGVNEAANAFAAPATSISVDELKASRKLLVDTRSYIDRFVETHPKYLRELIIAEYPNAWQTLYRHYRAARDALGVNHAYTVAVMKAYFGGKEDPFALPPLPVKE